MAKNIIYGVTGSIAAFKAAMIVSRLKCHGFDVTVIMTKSSQKFVSPLTFRTLSQNRVITDIFIEDDAYDPQHISIADKADIAVIAPATANIIGKLASGIADDALTSIVMTLRSVPVLIAPAMEERMYTNPITQSNIRILKEAGYQFVGPDKGRLASGRTGVGRMADIELIIQSIIDEAENKTGQGLDSAAKQPDDSTGREGSDAKDKTKDKKEKRLRRSAVTRLYESGSKRYGSLRGS